MKSTYCIREIGLVLMLVWGLVSQASAQVEVDPEVWEAAAQSDTVSILVFHREQPTGRIARDAVPELREQIRVLAEARRELALATRPVGPFATRSEEAAAGEAWAQAVTADQAQRGREIDDEIDYWMTRLREEILWQVSEIVSPLQDDLEGRLAGLGGQVTQRVLVLNVVAATVPSVALAELAVAPEILAIGLDTAGTPESDTSVPTTGAGSFWAGGSTGGAYDFGLVDTGVDATHPALSSHRFFTDIVGDTGFHGTHVTGIVASTDGTFRGGAYGLDAICSALGGSTSTSMASFDRLLSSSDEVPEVINHSWGYGTATADDSPMTRFCDAVVHDLFTMVTKSVGNGGCSSTTTSLTYPGPAYNILVVANMNDQNTTSRSDDFISADSSRGPTASGRRKPDLSAPGSGTDPGCPQTNDGLDIVSTYSGWASDVDFVSAWGTSMAAPHVASGILLLVESGVLTPMAQKAILINTAETWSDNGTDTPLDDAPLIGDQWNKTYGWGALDLQNAYFHRLDYFMGQVNPRNQAGSVRFFRGPLSNGDKLSLVWERRVGSNGDDSPNTWHALSDLNLRLYDANTQQLRDYDLDSNDNVHQVSAPTSFQGIAKVYSWSTAFEGAASETFALATEEGWESLAGPLAQIQIDMAEQDDVSATIHVTVQVANAGDLPLFNPIVTLGLPVGFISLGEPTIWSPGTLQPGASQTKIWSIRAGSTVGNFTLSTSLTSNTYGESFTASDSDMIELRPTFRLLAPADETVMDEAPELRWFTTGGVDLFAVELSLDGVTFIWNSFLNANLIIIDQRFELPTALWSQVPPGLRIHWRARGVYWGQGEPWTVFDSDEVWTFEKQ